MRQGSRPRASSSKGSSIAAEDVDAEGATSYEVAHFNGGGWAALRKFMERTSAIVVCGQEHHLIPSRLDEVSSAMRASGWKLIGHPCFVTEQGGHACGTFVAVRDWCGIRFLEETPCTNDFDTRVTSAIVEIPGLPAIAFHSVYMQVGIGMVGVNLRILAHIGALMTRVVMPWMVMGDWNCTPESLCKTGWLKKTGAAVLATERMTCITSKSASLIDYAVVSSVVAHLVSAPQVDLVQVPNPHRPVVYSMVANLRGLYKLVMLEYQKLPKQLPYGPSPQPLPEWAGVEAALRHVGDKLHDRCVHANDRAFDVAYKAFIDVAECEVARRGGVHLLAPGRRSAGPRMVQRPVVPQKAKERQAWVSTSRSARWLRNRLLELRAWLAEAKMEVQQLPKRKMAKLADLLQELQEGAPEDIAVNVELREVHQQVIQLVGSTLQDAQGGVLSQIGSEAEAVAEVLVTRVTTEAEAEKLRETLDADGKWTAWLDASMQGGHGKVHRWSKLPSRWIPTYVKKLDAGLTATPEGLLENGVITQCWKG